MHSVKKVPGYLITLYVIIIKRTIYNYNKKNIISKIFGTKINLFNSNSQYL